ncbi:RES family NAD+ phosphorylase [uncultured Cedecea sp.]|uniref:RES family NAD+ phosphorylase n=1 Tax=uncultured Cedecea sp. TaxID=988762 RepID=UPI0026171125|nr:RES family NAD+ phosphorylase [uncultured Cedecea sp.]
MVKRSGDEKPHNAEIDSLTHAGLLKTTTYLLNKGTLLHRIHHEQFAASQFNPGLQGNARFSPIQNAKGEPIPTLYAGMTKNCALMETVFHDVSFVPGLKTFDKSKLRQQVHSTLEIVENLKLVDLSSVALRKLGITRKELIDTEKDQYPITRQWAAKLYQQCPTAQGLAWVSRQDDTSRALMLFGDRIPRLSLAQTGQSLSLINDATTYDGVLELAERLDVLIIPGKD